MHYDFADISDGEMKILYLPAPLEERVIPA